MTNRRGMLSAALATQGLPPERVDAIMQRLGAVAKKKRRSKIKRIDRNRDTIVAARGKLTKAIAKAFKRSIPSIAEQITSIRDAQLGKADPTNDLASKVKGIQSQLDFAKWKYLPADAETIYTGVTKDGITVGFDQISFDPDADILDQANDDAIEWSRERAAELIGMTYDDDGELIDNPDAEWAITDSTRDMLRADITRAIEEGTSTSDLADDLEESYGFSESRAEAIARTELAMADIQGNLIGYKNSGVVSGKEVILGSEHNDPDECDDAADMGVVPLDSDFDGNGDPPFHTNCVCDVLPVLADDEDE